jgi:hypothetical protein
MTSNNNNSYTYTISPTTNKYTFFFNNITYPCSSDLDCPYQQVCFRNITWIDPPAQCGCPVIYDRIGFKCNEMGNGANLPASLAVISVIVNTCILLLCCRDFILIFQHQQIPEIKKSHSTITFTLILLLLSTIFGLIHDILYNGTIWGVFPIMYDASLGYKDAGPWTSSMAYCGLIFWSLFFVFADIVSLNVSLEWIVIVQKIQHLPKRNIKNRILIYRGLLHVYYLALCIMCITVCTTTGDVESITFIALPAMVFVIIAYAIAGTRIIYVLHTSLSIAPDAGAEKKLRQALFLIAKTAIGLSMFVFIGVIFDVAYNLCNGSDYVYQPTYDRPGYTLTASLSRPSYLCIELGLGLIGIYLHERITHIVYYYNKTTSQNSNNSSRLGFNSSFGTKNSNVVIDVIDDGNIGKGSGSHGVISVLAAKTLHVSQKATIFPVEKFWSHFIVTYILHTKITRRILNAIWSSSLAVAVIMIVSFPASYASYGYLFSICTCIGSGGMLLMTLSVHLLQMLIKRIEFIGIIITIVINGVLLGISLHDSRASIIPGLISMQLLAFLTDSLVIPNLRSLFIFNALLPTCVIVIVVMFNLAPDLYNAILPIGKSGYSLLQMLRDSLIAQIVQFCTELILIWRGKDRKRFIHLKDPVQYRLVLFGGHSTGLPAATNNNTYQTQHHYHDGRFHANASSVMVESGFVVKQESNDHQKIKTRIFVNKVAIKQRDCIAVHVFGEMYGEQVFHFITSRVGKLISIFSHLGAIIITITSGYYSLSISVAIIPFLLMLIIFEFAILSKRLCWLLCQRAAFITQFIFALVWLILAGYVLGDERFLIALYGFISYILSSLGDANTMEKKPLTMDVLQLFQQWQGTGVMVVFSLYLLLDIYSLKRDALLTLGNNNSNGTNAQDAGSFDFGQQIGDWGLFYFALPMLFERIIFGIEHYIFGHRTFSVIQSPIMPLYDDDDDSNIIEIQHGDTNNNNNNNVVDNGATPPPVNTTTSNFYINSPTQTNLPSNNKI